MGRVLLVDDNDDYITRFADQLRSANFEPVLATDYKSALEAFNSAPSVELVFCDIRLDRLGDASDGLTGIEFIQRMRSGTDTPVIVLSSESGVDEHSIRAGAELSIKRPDNPEALQDLIDSILIRSHFRRERYSCFISYSHKDERFARRLHDDLKEHEVQCWYAPHNLPIGAKTRNAIHLAIEKHDKLLLILSQHSVQSDWVEDEVSKALDLEASNKRLILFPIRIDDAVLHADVGWPATIRNTRNVGDFTAWKSKAASYSESLERLLRDLKRA